MSLISIISMVKNEEEFITEALDSILAQAGVELEIIVVDDYSTDSTFDILTDMSNVDSRLRAFKNTGKGKVDAFLYGCSKANGDYLAFFAGDDIMPEDSLLNRFNAMQNISSPAVLVSKIQVMSEDKKIDGILIPKTKGQGNPSGASIMIDRAAAKYILDIPASLPNEDTWMDLCIKYIKKLNVVHQDQVACFWRVHAGNSITIQQGFENFNMKFSSRMEALALFSEKYKLIMTQADRDTLLSIIKCEELRRESKSIRILFSDAPLQDKVRMFFYSNRLLFTIRRVLRAI